MIYKLRNKKTGKFYAKKGGDTSVGGSWQSKNHMILHLRAHVKNYLGLTDFLSAYEVVEFSIQEVSVKDARTYYEKTEGEYVKKKEIKSLRKLGVEETEHEKELVCAETY